MTQLHVYYQITLMSFLKRGCRDQEHVQTQPAESGNASLTDSIEDLVLRKQPLENETFECRRGQRAEGDTVYLGTSLRTNNLYENNVNC